MSDFEPKRKNEQIIEEEKKKKGLPTRMQTARKWLRRGFTALGVAGLVTEAAAPVTTEFAEQQISHGDKAQVRIYDQLGELNGDPLNENYKTSDQAGHDEGKPELFYPTDEAGFPTFLSKFNIPNFDHIQSMFRRFNYEQYVGVFNAKPGSLEKVERGVQAIDVVLQQFEKNYKDGLISQEKYDAIIKSGALEQTRELQQRMLRLNETLTNYYDSIEQMWNKAVAEEERINELNLPYDGNFKGNFDEQVLRMHFELFEQLEKTLSGKDTAGLERVMTTTYHYAKVESAQGNALYDAAEAAKKIADNMVGAAAVYAVLELMYALNELRKRWQQRKSQQSSNQKTSSANSSTESTSKVHIPVDFDADALTKPHGSAVAEQAVQFEKAVNQGAKPVPTIGELLYKKSQKIGKKVPNMQAPRKPVTASVNTSPDDMKAAARRLMGEQLSKTADTLATPQYTAQELRLQGLQSGEDIEAALKLTENARLFQDDQS